MEVQKIKQRRQGRGRIEIEVTINLNRYGVLSSSYFRRENKAIHPQGTVAECHFDCNFHISVKTVSILFCLPKGNQNNLLTNFVS